jgi:D-3-phosphoglycerate dehydrogenase
MIGKRVLVCDEIHEAGISLLKREGFEVHVKLNLTPDQLREEVKNYDVVVVRSRTVLSEDIIRSGERLKVICRAGVGLDNIDLEAAKSQGIKVLSTPEAPTSSVAELTIGLMIALARGITQADVFVKKGEWKKKELVGFLLKGKTIGIVGFGRIGKSVSKIAKAIGMNILVTDPLPDEKVLREIGGKAVYLNELLETSDVITLHVPLTSKTWHLIDEEALKKMKRGALVINTSRGGVVDEKALLKALKEGWIAGAALDVYEVEPPTSLELVRMPNVVCTPHIGAQTYEAQKLASVMIAEKLIKSWRTL